MSYKKIVELKYRYDRHHNFWITKYHHSAGNSFYAIENRSKSQVIVVHQRVFERFRLLINRLSKLEKYPSGKLYVIHKLEKVFAIGASSAKDGSYHIKEVRPTLMSTGHLQLTFNGFKGLNDLLHLKGLEEANHLLSRMISYHKAYQLTFVEDQSSLNSDLSIRKSILGHQQEYKPSFSGVVTPNKKKQDKAKKKKSTKKVAVKKSPTRRGLDQIKAKLGERFGQSPYKVDYESLLQAKNHPGKIPVKARIERKNEPISHYGLNLSVELIKKCEADQFTVDFDPEEMAYLRKNFLAKKNQDYYLGFEMVQAVFKKRKKHLSYCFPLFYIKVKVKQSNRQLMLIPDKEPVMFLNHIALYNLVEVFSKGARKKAVENFFNTLLAQNFVIDSLKSRIYLQRQLPVSEEYFSKVREFFFGEEGKNGKRGVFADLALSGVECDVGAAHLYQQSHHLSAASQVLDFDLDRIHGLAKYRDQTFRASLLNRFLHGRSKTAKDKKGKEQTVVKGAMMPGALSASMKKLIHGLESHDLIVLEGPPGTGKTHTICNLLIDAICKGQRVVVVSDRDSAIEAVSDKLDDYFTSTAQNSKQHQQMRQLWRKVVPSIEQLPDGQVNAGKFLTAVKKHFFLDVKQDTNSIPNINYKDKIEDIDDDIAVLRKRIDESLKYFLGSETSKASASGVGDHPKKDEEQRDFIRFVSFLDEKIPKTSSSIKTGFDLFSLYLQQLEDLQKGTWKDFYQYFSPDIGQKQYLTELKQFVDQLDERKIVSVDDILKLSSDFPNSKLIKIWSKILNTIVGSSATRLMDYIKSLYFKFRPPLQSKINSVRGKISKQLKILELLAACDQKIQHEFNQIFAFLHPEKVDRRFPLSLDFGLYQRGLKEKLRLLGGRIHENSVYEYLQKISKLQAKRDHYVLMHTIAKLHQMDEHINDTLDGDSTPLRAKVNFLFERLIQSDTITKQPELLRQLQSCLWQAYPIILCRKQLVPLLFPCKAQSIDLLIVDEATQCKVDETIPLLLRAKKFMVVGDEKQTVLAKHSVVDDYLFAEYNLPEHLLELQATGIKGGGSHIFALLKNIQQTSVLLDEHYRCPPDIISFSNRYVYQDQLKIMQWKSSYSKPSVVVNYDEQDEKDSERVDMGSFKGIETDMIKRFLKYVEAQIKKIERQTGKRIDVGRDVAICYFLIKNKAYFDHVKSRFLARLNRGDDILSGAGRELQGKERDYIFYYWDCQRSNFAAFKQGDDPNTRQGELNVLMSRPKKMAFHYLHKNFDRLAHHKSSITDYLWKHYQNSQRQSELSDGAKETTEMGSGKLILKIIGHIQGQELLSSSQPLQLGQARSGLLQNRVIGDSKQMIDLIFEGKKQSLAIKDLSCYQYSPNLANDIIDYYFQLKRVQPKLLNVFCFLHDFIEQDGEVRRKVLRY